MFLKMATNNNLMYRLSIKKRKYSTTPIVKIEIDNDGKEKESIVLLSCLPKKDGEKLMKSILELLNNNIE